MRSYLDGVFARGDDGHLRFHGATELDAADVADVLAAITPGVHRVLARGGDPEDPHGGDAFADASPLLAGLAAASVQGVVALGGTPETRPRRVGQSSTNRGVPALGACHARWEDFDLHAAVRVPAGQRDRLERVCRYALRPPVAGTRLQLTSEGQVVLQLRHPWADGTTHVAFTPTAFLERLAVLVPRPRVNLRDVPRAPGPASRVACRGGAAPRPTGHGRRSRRGGVRCDPSPVGARGGVGRPDAPRVRDRRAGLSPLWRSAAAHRADRGVGRGAADSAAPGPSCRRAETFAGARTTDRRRRRLAVRRPSATRVVLIRASPRRRPSGGVLRMRGASVAGPWPAPRGGDGGLAIGAVQGAKCGRAQGSRVG